MKHPETIANREEELQDERMKPQEEPSPAKGRARLKWIFVAVLIVAAAGGFFLWHHYAGREGTDDAQIDGNIVPIAARVGGTVVEIAVEDNQQVTAGTLLVKLDPRDYQVALSSAQAELADAQATAAAARAGVPITSVTTSGQLSTALAALAAVQQQVEAARAQLAEAQAKHQKAATDEKRYAQLIEKDEISRQRYEDAVAAEKASAAAVDSARAAVASAESQVRQAEGQVAIAGSAPQQVSATQSRANAALATVQKQQAALEQAKLNLQYTTIVAPVSGIVSQKQNVQLGQIVQPGQPLMALVPPDDIWVTANFKETQLREMRPGQRAIVHVDAYARDFNAHIDSIGAATGARFSLLPPENATGNYVKVVQRIPVKLVFEKGQDPQHLLRPGMSVYATVLVQ